MDYQDQAKEIAELYSALQKKICTTLEEADGGEKFNSHPWEKSSGSGLTNVLQGGNIIEKAGVNFSHVSGPLTDGLKKILGEDAGFYAATGISSIIHAGNPFVPTIHMNVRYFALDNGVEWFGGGIDLTPSYIDTAQARQFHLRLKTICDKYNENFYPGFKEWADNYFYIEHRNETRGVGGIFFDRQKPDEKTDRQQWIGFTSELAEVYGFIYAGLMEANGGRKFTSKNSAWQKLRRGRYVEFNLVYDRGTKFGLESGGNIESILVSMPPEASWEFNQVPELNSQEERTLHLLKKGIDWINYTK
ncbi:MAG: oxygen-dependent coproporphyrinogen oxidase [Bacteroidales bacterium]